MIEYRHKGMCVVFTAELKVIEYRGSGGMPGKRFRRRTSVGVRFWDFHLEPGNLCELCTVQSIHS